MERFTKAKEALGAGEHAAALRLVDAIPAPNDVRLAEEQLLLRFVILRGMGKPDEAAAGLRRALGVEQPQRYVAYANVLASFKDWSGAADLLLRSSQDIATPPEPMLVHVGNTFRIEIRGDFAAPVFEKLVRTLTRL